MKKLTLVAAAMALLAGMAAQAATLKENMEFPDSNIIMSQTNWTSQLGLQDRVVGVNTNDLSIGQSFTIDSPTTLRAITLQNHSARSWGAGTHVLELWIGENDGTTTNFVAGATHLLTTVDLQSTSISTLGYISLNLDSDLALPAGDYGFELNWTTQDASHFMYAKRSDGVTNLVDGSWLYDTTVGGTLPFDDPETPIANDLVFALHTATVGTIPSFTVAPEELTMLVGPTDNQVTGTVAVAYTADKTMDIILSVSDESHPGSFSVLSTNPQTLVDPSPSNTILEIEFDNTVSNLVEGQTATGLVTIAWSETGSGITNESFVSLTANTGFAPNANNAFVPTVGTWGDMNNWNLGRVPGTLGADRALIQGAVGRICNVETNFTGLFPYRVWIRGGSGLPPTLNISADLKGSADISVGQSAGNYGIANQTAGDVETGALLIGDPGATAPSNSYYNLLGGTLSLDANTTIHGTGVLNIDGGTLSIDQGPVNINMNGTGLVQVVSGMFESVGTAPSDVLTINNPLEISGGTVALNGQNKFAGGLTVIGDAASISVHRFGTPSATGEVTFVMGETGVSTIVGPSWATLSSYNLTVDGSNYAGVSTTIDLVTAVNLTAGFASVTITNFAEGVTTSITQDEGNDNKVILTINVPGYDGWIGGYGLSGSPDADMDYDYDGDGEDNFYEYAFGGIPNDINIKGYVPEISTVNDGGTSYFEYVYARRIGTELELDYTAEFGSNLVFTNWTTTVVVELPIPGTIDADYKSVTNRVDMTGKPVGFMQVTVEEL